jgi:hypothetical protein
MLRYLNMFVLIGIVLVILSLAGFATGNRFVTEPGQAATPQLSLIYLGAGVLMLINGYISIKQAESQKNQLQEPAPADVEKE